MGLDLGSKGWTIGVGEEDLKDSGVSIKSRKEFIAVNTVAPSWSNTASHSGMKPATVGIVATAIDENVRNKFCDHKSKQ